MTEDYSRFVEQYLEAKSWPERKDGPPVELLDKLTPAERERAEGELISRLDTWDSWPAVGLGHMRSQKAAPNLYALLARARGTVKAEVATALWKICGDEEMLRVVLDLSGRSWLQRLNPLDEFRMLDIIHCLAQFPQPEAGARLEELKSDRDKWVAHNAECALRLRKRRYGTDTQRP
jgi:hypothetical protein